MILFLKSASRRRVNNNEESSSAEERESYCCKEIIGRGSSVLTVWRKSLLMSCSGFTVIDGKGNLVFRVDNYCGKPGEIVLMDASGKSMLTVRRQKTIRSLVDTWVIYEGEPNEKPNKKSTIPSKKKQPIWYVKKQMSLLQAPNSKELAQVYSKTSKLDAKKTKSNNNNNSNKIKKRPKYVIQGSYCQRSCQIIDLSSNDVVAEIRRKEAINGCASFGLEVFHLIVWPGFDAGFAMTLVLLLDQMFS